MRSSRPSGPETDLAGLVQHTDAGSQYTSVHHTGRRLPDSSQITATQADVREPEAVLNSPGVAQLLDFTRPVAVLAVGILDLLAEEDEPDTVVQDYRTALAPWARHLTMSAPVATLPLAPMLPRRRTRLTAPHGSDQHTPDPVPLGGAGGRRARWLCTRGTRNDP